MNRMKESERRLFIFIFRLNIVLRDSYHVYEIVMEIEEWKSSRQLCQKLRRILLCLLEASIASYRNCIIRILGLIIVNYLI